VSRVITFETAPLDYPLFVTIMIYEKISSARMKIKKSVGIIRKM